MATIENDNIIPTVAEVYGVNEYDIAGKSRKQPIAEARQMCMYLYWEAGYGFPIIGAMFGRDRVTAYKAAQTIRDFMSAHKCVKERYQLIKSKL